MAVAAAVAVAVVAQVLDVFGALGLGVITFDFHCGADPIPYSANFFKCYSYCLEHMGRYSCRHVYTAKIF